MSVATVAALNHLDPAHVLLIGAHLRVPVKRARASLAAGAGVVQIVLDTWAARLDVSPHLVRALAWMESGYQPGVVSVGRRARCAPGDADDARLCRARCSSATRSRTPSTGDIEVGVLYLRHLLSQFDGDTPLALGAWYQGEAAVKRFGLYHVTKPFVEDVLALVDPDVTRSRPLTMASVELLARPLDELMAEARAVREARTGRLSPTARRCSSR